jgi:malate permease and related proteins
MEISLVFYSIMMITIMVLVGALLAKTFPFNEDTRKVFVNIIVNIAMPCIILSSIFHMEMNGGIFKKMLLVFFISIAINTAGIGIGWILAQTFLKELNKSKEIALLSGLGNTGFIGIPLCALLLGPEGAFFAAVFDAGVDVTIWTIGIFMLQKTRVSGIKTIKTMINIPNIAIVFGLSIAYFQLTPPAIVIDITERLAALASPLAMFYIGILIMTLKSKQRNYGRTICIPISVKLIILPFLSAIVLIILDINELISQTIIIQSMMPSITLASILFAKYSADEEFGAMTTVISNIISLITIPAMIIGLNYIQAL